MLLEDYDSKGSGGKVNSDRWSEEAWCQDELNGRKPPVVKSLILIFWTES
jgi:hypothetical protein